MMMDAERCCELTDLCDQIDSFGFGIVWLPGIEKLTRITSLKLSVKYCISIADARKDLFAIAFTEVDDSESEAFVDTSEVLVELENIFRRKIIVFHVGFEVNSAFDPTAIYIARLPNDKYLPLVRTLSNDDTQEDLFQRKSKLRRIGQIMQEHNLASEVLQYTEVMKPITVGLIGETGAGKSQLINSVLGSQIMPIGVAGPCTAYPVRVTRKEGEANDFTVIIHFINFTEIELNTDSADKSAMKTMFNSDKQELELFCDEMRNNAVANIEDSDATLNYLRNKLKERSPLLYDAIESRQLRLPLDDPIKVRRLLKNLREPSSRILPKRELESFRQLTDHEGSPLWCIVNLVEVFGNFSDLPFDVCLLDLPGLNDANTNRTVHTFRMIKSCDKLVIVTKANGTLSKSSDLPILNSVFSEISSPSDIIVCATQIDRVQDVTRIADDVFQDVDDSRRYSGAASWLALEYIRLINQNMNSADLFANKSKLTFADIMPLVLITTTHNTELPSMCSIINSWTQKHGLKVFKSLLFQHSSTVSKDVDMKIHHIDSWVKDIEKERVTLIGIAFPEGVREIQRFAINLFDPNRVEEHVREIKIRGDWENCSISRNNKMDSLACAIRDGGRFKSKSQYSRQNINLVTDFTYYLTEMFRPIIEEDRLRFSQFVATTTRVVNAIDTLNLLTKSVFLRNIQALQANSLMPTVFLIESVINGLRLGRHAPLVSGSYGLDYLRTQGILILRSLGSALINAAIRRNDEIIRAIALAEAEIRIPDEIKTCIRSALASTDYFIPRRCLSCDEIVPSSLCFDLCPNHCICNICARVYSNALLSDAHNKFPLVCFQCRFECPNDLSLPIVSAAKFRENRLLLCLSDADVLKLEHFELNASIPNPVFCRKPQCGKILFSVAEVKADNGFVECPYCACRSCAHCLILPVHDGVTCEEAKQRCATDELSQQTIASTTTACPRCGFRIIKAQDHGCHHIGYGTNGCRGVWEGRQCGFHYCSECGKGNPDQGPGVGWRICNCPPSCNPDIACRCLPCFECKLGQPCESCPGPLACRSCQTRRNGP
jgi:hypothetical protein